MSKKFMLLFIFFTVAVTMFSQTEGKKIFKWSFIYVDNNLEKNFVNVADSIELENGNYFKFYFQPISNAYIYVYRVDSNNNLTVIFPENFKNNLDDAGYYIPDGSSWFFVEGKNGEEIIHILVSNEKLVDLEKFTSIYDKKTKKGVVSNKNTLKYKENLLNEIINVKRQNSKFVVFAEKPASLAGTTKSIDNLDELATEVEFDKFYAKTIRIKY